MSASHTLTRVLHAGYTGAIRPALFRVGGGDPEVIHEQMIQVMARVPAPVWRAVQALTAPPPGPPITVAGLTVTNPVGLAAGLDKDARAPLAWQALGFGFLELGTVTPRPQPGNPSPRLFRLVDDRALINRMGFNNAGSAALAARLTRFRGQVPIGVSLGKNKTTPNEEAAQDYVAALADVAPVADYVAVNVSSPNTPGLRLLQSRSALNELFTALTRARPPGLPIWVKVAPDLGWDDLEEVVAAAEETGIDAIVATNTTLGRTRADGTPLRSAQATQAGGLSGAPLTLRAREVVAHLSRITQLPIIGSGGVMSPHDALALRDAGASLVQLYSGFIYSGPALVRGVAQAWRTGGNHDLR